MSKVRLIIPIIALIGIGAVIHFAPPTLSVRIRPIGIMQAPGSCDIEVNVDHSPDNRQLDVILDGIDFYRSSTVVLKELSSSTFNYRYDRLPPGEYVAEAVLTQSVMGKWREVRRRSNMLTVY